VEAVELAGGRSLDADLVVAGLGVEPATGFLARSGLELDNGVLVDERFQTRVPGVYAAGDVARFWDPLFGRRRRIEHWSNASYQGTRVGAVLAGAAGGYDTLSSFFTEVFGITIRVFGEAGGDRLVYAGSLASGVLGLYFEGSRLVGAVAVGQDEATESRVKEGIRSGAAFPAPDETFERLAA
jgi:NADPH-dependent 2,4-dienoyl-CoA reductase/sulfur reductase-like enzyme